MNRDRSSLNGNPHLKEVIVCKENRGDGVEDDPIRNVTKVYCKDGSLLAEHDPYKERQANNDY